MLSPPFHNHIDRRPQANLVHSADADLDADNLLRLRLRNSQGQQYGDGQTSRQRQAFTKSTLRPHPACPGR